MQIVISTGIMSNDGLIVEIIDQSHGEQAVEKKAYKTLTPQLQLPISGLNS